MGSFIFLKPFRHFNRYSFATKAINLRGKPSSRISSFCQFLLSDFFKLLFRYYLLLAFIKLLITIFILVFISFFVLEPLNTKLNNVLWLSSDNIVNELSIYRTNFVIKVFSRIFRLTCFHNFLI